MTLVCRPLPNTCKPEEVRHVHVYNYLYGDFHSFLHMYVNRDLDVIDSNVTVLVTTN